MNGNSIPKSGIFKQSRRSLLSGQRMLNQSLNVSQSTLNDQYKSRDRMSKPNSTTAASAKSNGVQQICAKFERENSRSIESIKCNSSHSHHSNQSSVQRPKKKQQVKVGNGKRGSNKSSLKSKAGHSASINSSKANIEQNSILNNSIDTKQDSRHRQKDVNLSFQSLRNKENDITANFQSLQNSFRLRNHRESGQSLQTGNRFNLTSESQGKIINIQTPHDQDLTQEFSYQHLRNNHLEVPQRNIAQYAKLNQASTDRSSGNQNDNPKAIGPLSGALVNPSTPSLLESAATANNQYYSQPEFNSGQQYSTYSPVKNSNSTLENQQNYLNIAPQTSSFQNNYHYNPTFQGSSSKSNQKLSASQHSAVSPAKQAQASNPLSFLTSATPTQLSHLTQQLTQQMLNSHNLSQLPLTQNHGAFLLQKLELFWKERLLRLQTNISQLRDSALTSDDIVRTMLLNSDTQDFADQRIQELVKEGIHMEQEIQIEQLSKQVVIASNELTRALQQRDQFANDFNKLFEDHQILRNSIGEIQSKLKVKKGKSKESKSIIESLKSEILKSKGEREHLLEKLKILQNQNGVKMNETESKIDEMQRLFHEQEIEKQRMQELINNLTNEIHSRENQHSLIIHEIKEKFSEQLIAVKKSVKEKYSSKIENLKKGMQDDMNQRVQEINILSERKIESKSRTDQQNFEYLQNEIQELKAKLDATVSIQEHETILNSQLRLQKAAHEKEIDLIKEAFEKELRKAEKLVRQSVKKEEERLKQSVFEFEKNLEQMKHEKQNNEVSHKNQVLEKEAQIGKLKEILQEKESTFTKEVANLKDRIKQGEMQIQSLEMSKKDQIEKIKIENTKQNLNLSFQIKEHLAKIDQLENKVYHLEESFKQKELHLIEKEDKLEQLKIQLVKLEAEYSQFQKRQLEKSTLLSNKSDELGKLKQEHMDLKIRMSELKGKMGWKLQRQQEKCDTFRNEVALLKRLFKQEIEFIQKELQQQFLLNINQIAKKTQKQMNRMLQNQDQDFQQKISRIENEKGQIAIRYTELKNLNDEMKVQNEQLEQQIEKQKLQYQQQIDQLQTDQSREIGNLNLQLQSCEKLKREQDQMIIQEQEELIQLRSDNQILNHKLNEIDQIVQELDFKLKNVESERDLFKEQLILEEKHKAEENHNLRASYQERQDQLINDFKEQCLRLRGEIEETYQQKLKNKVQQLKAKQENEINEIIQKFEERDKDHNEKIESLKNQNEQISFNYQSEIQKLRREYKRLLTKYKLSKQKDQENSSKIEEEVFKSLAKVNQSFQHSYNGVNRGGNNMSMISYAKKHSSRQSSRLVDRTYFQNLTNQSIYLNQPSGRDTGDFANGNIAAVGIYSARGKVNNSFSTIQAQGVGMRLETKSITPHSYRNNGISTKSSGHHSYKQDENLKFLMPNRGKDSSISRERRDDSTLLQDIGQITNNMDMNHSNANNYSMKIQKISPISKSLNQTDFSQNIAGQNSFILIGENQSIHKQPYEDSFSRDQHHSRINMQHQSLMKMKFKEDAKFQGSPNYYLTSKISQARNPLQESSLNQVLNVSNDLIMGGMLGVTDSFMDYRQNAVQSALETNAQQFKRQNEVNNSQSSQNHMRNHSQIQRELRESQDSNDSQPSSAIGGVLLNSGMNNDDSFLIARSLSPEITGKFGSFKRQTQSQNVE